MRKLIFAFVFLFLLITELVDAQQAAVAGAWRLSSQEGGSEPEPEGEMVVIYTVDYFMIGQYTKDGSFISAGGGNYRLQGRQCELIYDFHTEDEDLIRQPQQYTILQDGQRLGLEREGTRMWFDRIDSGNSPLAGAWRFATRLDEDGKPGERRGDGPRQTVKVLSGDRFQWAAFNYETKQFSGSGGGTYELRDGKYIETIEFFSKDDSRAGLSLEFDYEIKGDDWYHKGQSTTGNPVREIWERK